MGNSPVAMLKKNGGDAAKLYTIHTDHLGTPRQVTHAVTNAVVWEWSGEPFGTSTPNEDPGRTGKKFTLNLRYAGQYYDQESNLFHNGFRDYSLQIGRYVQSDPIGLAGGINTYNYVEGSPVKHVDPTGLDTYVVNRNFLSIGASAVPWWDVVSHTLTFSTNLDGSIAATYSWGNDANLQGWGLNQPEDISAAQQALQNGYAQKIAPYFMDIYYSQAFNQLNNPANNHGNGIFSNNCKIETGNLNTRAWQLWSGGQ